MTLNRPEVNNACDQALIQGLHDAMDGLATLPVPTLALVQGHQGGALEFAWGAVDEAVLERLSAQHAAKRRSAEAAEGLASFAQKRGARWG